jgi:hypothetical protein
MWRGLIPCNEMHDTFVLLACCRELILDSGREGITPRGSTVALHSTSKTWRSAAIVGK